MCSKEREKEEEMKYQRSARSSGVNGQSRAEQQHVHVLTDSGHAPDFITSPKVQAFAQKQHMHGSSGILGSPS